MRPTKATVKVNSLILNVLGTNLKKQDTVLDKSELEGLVIALREAYNNDLLVQELVRVKKSEK